VAFALEVAREVIGFDPNLSEERVCRAVMGALGAIEPDLAIVVRVHPSQVEVVRDSLAADPARALSFPSLVADEGIEVGGAVVTAGPITIDAQMGTALERLRRAFESLREGSQ
jgi:flagellar biosynthesis/type III secretory pathway protein FliH